MTTDGQRVVFTEVPMLERLPNEAPRDLIRRRTEAQRLFSITPDGLDTRVLQPEEASRVSRDRGLSPDGRWLVYAKQVEGVVGLYLQERSSGQSVSWTVAVADRKLGWPAPHQGPCVWYRGRRMQPRAR